MNITKELYEETLLVASWLNKEKPVSMSTEDYQRIIQRNKAHINTILNTYSFEGYDKKVLLDALN
jgi:hypothetical protein